MSNIVMNRTRSYPEITVLTDRSYASMVQYLSDRKVLLDTCALMAYTPSTTRVFIEGLCKLKQEHPQTTLLVLQETMSELSNKDRLGNPIATVALTMLRWYASADGGRIFDILESITCGKPIANANFADATISPLIQECAFHNTSITLVSRDKYLVWGTYCAVTNPRYVDRNIAAPSFLFVNENLIIEPNKYARMEPPDVVDQQIVQRPYSRSMPQARYGAGQTVPRMNAPVQAACRATPSQPASAACSGNPAMTQGYRVVSPTPGFRQAAPVESRPYSCPPAPRSSTTKPPQPNSYAAAQVTGTLSTLASAPLYREQDAPRTGCRLNCSSRLGMSFITLGKRINGGTEADIYRVCERSNLLAKIFKQPSSRTAAKVEYLSSLDDMPGVALPRDVLKKGSVFVGYLMEYADGAPLNTFFVKRTRDELTAGTDFDRRNMTQAALEYARLYARLSELGVLLVDVNPQNVMLLREKDSFPGRVCILDVDSAQVRLHDGSIVPAGGYTPDYMDWAVNFTCDTLLSEAQAMYGFLTAIFQVCMAGSHPFDVFIDNMDISRQVASRRGDFGYPTGGRYHALAVTVNQANKIRYSYITKELKRLFGDVFHSESAGHADVTRRPAVQRLIENLQFMVNELADDHKLIWYGEMRALEPTEAKPFYHACDSCRQEWLRLGKTLFLNHGQYLCKACGGVPASTAP